MSEQKEKFPSHLHGEDDKVESPESIKPVDSLDVTGVKPVRESPSCDQGNNNGESVLRDSENRHLDSVLEYANRIRAFVGFENDDSKELPPPPLPKPLVIDDTSSAVDQNLTGEDIHRESDINAIGNIVTQDIIHNRDLHTNEPELIGNDIVHPDSSLCLPIDILDDQNNSVQESENIVNLDSSLCVPIDILDDQSNSVQESKNIVNPDSSLCVPTDSPGDQNINVKEPEDIVNPDSSLGVPLVSIGDENNNINQFGNTVNPNGLCASNDPLFNQNSNINESSDTVNPNSDSPNNSLRNQSIDIDVDEYSNVKNSNESFPVTPGSVDSELRLLDSAFGDGGLTTSLSRDSTDDIEKIVINNQENADSSPTQLKNSISDSPIPSTMINNGYINDDGKELPKYKNASNAMQSLQMNNENNLEVAHQITEKNKSQEEKKNKESHDEKPILERDFQSDEIMAVEVPREMIGTVNAGFENDISESSSKENDKNESAELESSNRSSICNDRGTVSENQTENQLLNDTVSGKTAEVFLFDPEYVEELQKECQPMEDEVKPMPDMAVLRRLSMDVVNKVLDDAGSQIREILDERKRSNMELNNLVSNAEELIHNTFPDENTSATSNLRTQDENGELPNIDGSSHEADKAPKQNEIQLKDVLAKTYDFQDFQKKFETEMNKFDPRYDVDPDTVCGIGSFTPKWIQPFATSRTYVTLYSIVGMLSGSYYTYLIGIISTLEKRFAFKSKISGTIMMVDEITPLFLGILIGYFGGKAHRPRMVGLGMLLSAICCFVSALPYFIYGPATHLNVLNVRNETNVGMCDSEPQTENCDSDDRPPTLAAILFLMLGSFLKGFGNLAYYAVGLAYMDDNSKKKNTPMYFATSMSMRLVGPLLGFLLSSACLKFHENPFDDPGFGPEDPRWIGGWWMGFLLQGLLLFIFAIPISLFPRKLPGHRNPLESESEGPIPNFTGLIAALKRLGKNPLFVFIVLNTIVAIFGAFGHYIMLPKYMENQFHLSASDASLFSGPPGIAAVMTSTVIGGYLIWKFKPSPKILTAGMLTVEVVAALGFLILMIPQCERVQMTNFGFSDEGLILESACNVNCNCSTSAFTPVCGPDGKTTYFSPCYAGCSESSNKTFSNCSCVPDSIGEQIVTKGYCLSEGCWSKALGFIVILPIIQLIVSLLRVSHTMVLLRSIEPADKSVALGTFEAFLCAFGFIPFPVVYGAIVDSTCLVWESSCGKTGNCWFYDVDRFNYLLHGSSAGFSALSILCLIVIFSLSGRVKNMYEDDVVSEDTKKQDNLASSETKM